MDTAAMWLIQVHNESETDIFARPLDVFRIESLLLSLNWISDVAQSLGFVSIAIKRHLDRESLWNFSFAKRKLITSKSPYFRLSPLNIVKCTDIFLRRFHSFSIIFPFLSFFNSPFSDRLLTAFHIHRSFPQRYIVAMKKNLFSSVYLLNRYWINTFDIFLDRECRRKSYAIFIRHSPIRIFFLYSFAYVECFIFFFIFFL